MRTMAVARIDWRHWRVAVWIFLGVVLISSVITLGVMMRVVPATASIEVTTGGLRSQVSHEMMSAYRDPDALVSQSSFGLVILIAALVLTGRMRRMLVNLSMTRIEILTGNFVFLAGLSVLLTLAGGWVIPVLLRGFLWAAGFPVQGGWSAATLLSGNNTSLVSGMLIDLCSMIELAGWMTLIGCVFRRWWKILLILMGAGVLMMILIGTQLESSRLLQTLVTRVVDWLQYFLEVLLPRIEAYLRETNSWLLCGRSLLGGVIATALSYPVLRGMKVQ